MTQRPTLEGTYMPLLDIGGISQQFKTIVEQTVNPNDLLQDKDVVRNPIETHHHITLHMGLHQDKELYSKIAKETQPFEFTVKGFGCFSNLNKRFDDGSLHSYDIVWVGVQDTTGSLESLHKNFGRTFNKTWSHPEFKPHLTLAYFEYGKGQQYVREHTFEEHVVQVNGFIVKKYRDRETTPDVYRLGV